MEVKLFLIEILNELYPDSSRSYSNFRILVYYFLRVLFLSASNQNYTFIFRCDDTFTTEKEPINQRFEII